MADQVLISGYGLWTEIGTDEILLPGFGVLGENQVAGGTTIPLMMHHYNMLNTGGG